MRALRQRYRVVREVSGPRAAAVFEAEDRVLGGRVALKTLPIGHDLAPALANEAQRQGALRHPLLAQVTDRFSGVTGFDDRTVVGLATRWIDGPTLTAWGRSRTDPERLTAIHTLLGTLSWLHARGWLHLDLKPDNVLMLDGRPCVIDLGTAVAVGSGAGTAGGTLGYAAPEVVQGAAPDVASDVFSIGVLAFELLAGRSPFAGEGSQLREAVLSGRSRSLTMFRPDLSPSLAGLVQRMLAGVAAERPSSLSGVCAALEQHGVVPLADGGQGELPLRGRTDELADLMDLVASRPSAPITVVGPRGLGRQRLAHGVMEGLDVDDGALHVDLTQAKDGMTSALQDLLATEGAPGKGRLDDPRLGAWLDGQALSGVLYLGRREAWESDLQEAAPSLLPSLAQAGLTVLLVDAVVFPGSVVFAPKRLSIAQLRDLALWRGEGEHPSLDQAVQEADGCVGRMFWRLEHPPFDAARLPGLLRDRWDELSVLLPPVSAAVVDALPGSLRSAWELAVEVGAVVAVDSGFVFEMPPSLPDTPTPPMRALGEALLNRDVGLTSSQRAVLAARTGQDELARAWLSPFGMDHRGRPDVREVARRLAYRDDPHAILLHGATIQLSGDRTEVEELLRRLPESDPNHAQLHSLQLREEGSSAAADMLLAWLDRHGDNVRIRAEAIFCVAMTSGDLVRAGSLITSWLADPDIDPRFCEVSVGRQAHLQVLIKRAVDDDDPGPLRAMVEGLTQDEGWEDRVGTMVLYGLKKAYSALEDQDASLRIAELINARADQQGTLLRILSSRATLGGRYMDYGRSEPARQRLHEALGLAVQLRRDTDVMKLRSLLAEVEITSRRLPAALRHLRAYEVLREHAPEHIASAARARSRILWASYHVALGRPEQAVQLLAEVEEIEQQGAMVRTWRAITLMEAYVDLGAFDQALQLANSLAHYDSPNVQRRVQLALGRTHLGLARAHLARAVEDLPEDPDPMEHDTLGRALLAAGGEDLDPGSFARRREQLQRATAWLDDDQRVRAIALRERLLEGPGAGLDQVVRLIESVGDGSVMLEILAQVVSAALGANRVLVMLRMPGLGRQMTAREISGQESAGLAPEIWRRVRRPGDVWLADDAFADPNLRRMSATVRTFQIKSVVAVAIPKDNRVIGVLYVDDVHRSGRFGEADVEVLQRLARAIGAVAEVLPARPPRDGLTVHDLHGFYTCDGELAGQVTGVLERVQASSQANLLLTGPTGAGKTWLASRVATDVLGLDGLIEVVLRPGPTEMLVSQLWGTRRGDFTGAIERPGAIFQAWSENKALFLDELQNLDEVGQRVLLPLLELPRRRFGSLTSGVRELDRPLHVILGTNAAVARGSWSETFREDLWYRVSSVRIDLPPLSERGREAVYRHLEDLLNQQGLPAPEDVFERAALQRLATHSWPGNLRSLADLAERAALRYRDDQKRIPVAALDGLGLDQPSWEPPRPGRSSDAPALLTAQARAVLEALERHDFVQASAADELGVSKFALHRMLKKLELIDHVREQRHRLRQARSSGK